MSLLTVRNIIMYSVVAAILVVAAFGIYNTISTIVMEKTRDIAIMKSMGFHAGDIRVIFVGEGLMLGLLGSTLGLGLGALLMLLLAHVEIHVPSLGDPTNLPIYFGTSQFLIAFGFAMASATAAAWLPARKAGRVQPVDILRGSM
jgi:lipoprotein-releasing system permease protein